MSFSSNATVDLSTLARDYPTQMSTKPILDKQWLDNRAVDIVRRLQEAGFESYLVGGCVRDLLAGFHPKDYDIATAAQPNKVKSLISRAYVIGRRFRLVLVKRGLEQFEVATFRRDASPEEIEDESMPSADNIFGTPEEDARRRDFTINGIFYDPIKDEILDYVNGMSDIEGRTLRMIGDPETRLKEDPIRILRALRLSNKLNFTIEPKLRKALISCADELPRSVLPRKREEMLKILRLPDPGRVLVEAHDIRVLNSTWNSLNDVLGDQEKRDLFLLYLGRIHDFVVDRQSPIELFAILATAFAIAKGHLDPTKNVPTGHYSNNEEIKLFLKDEVGVFAAEMNEICGAWEMAPKLLDMETFIRKGRRRQQALISQPSFPLALRLAELEHLLPPQVLHFWKARL